MSQWIAHTTIRNLKVPDMLFDDTSGYTACVLPSVVNLSSGSGRVASDHSPCVCSYQAFCFHATKKVPTSSTDNVIQPSHAKAKSACSSRHCEKRVHPASRSAGQSSVAAAVPPIQKNQRKRRLATSNHVRDMTRCSIRRIRIHILQYTGQHNT
jgi:hypothetical protein